MTKKLYIQPATASMETMLQNQICIGSPTIDNNPVKDQWGDAPMRRLKYLAI